MSEDWKTLLNGDPMPWLLDGRDPAVTAQALQLFEGKPADDPVVQAHHIHAMQSDPIKTILANQSPDGWWFRENPKGTYKKYEGSSWNLLFLAELGASPQDERVLKGCQDLLEHNYVELLGAFSLNNKPSGCLVCFNAHMVYALTLLGFGLDPRVQAAINWIISQQADSGAFSCRVMEYSLLPDCVMVIPKVLKMVAMIPYFIRSQELQAMTDRAVDYLMSVRLYQYVYENTKEWFKATREKPIGQIREMKLTYDPGLQNVKKKGWLRFQFPLHYNSDLLEVLWALARLEVPITKEIEIGIAKLLFLQIPHGKWEMKNSLNGKMWADIEQKGKPSRWLTLKACEVLQFYA